MVSAGAWARMRSLVAALNMTPLENSDAESGQVPSPGRGIEGVGDRPGEGVADDPEALDLLGDDGVEESAGVEAAVGDGDDAAALVECGQGEPQGGAVHERRRRQHPRPRRG